MGYILKLLSCSNCITLEMQTKINNYIRRHVHCVISRHTSQDSLQHSNEPTLPRSIPLPSFARQKSTNPADQIFRNDARFHPQERYLPLFHPQPTVPFPVRYPSVSRHVVLISLSKGGGGVAAIPCGSASAVSRSTMKGDRSAAGVWPVVTPRRDHRWTLPDDR